MNIPTGLPQQGITVPTNYCYNRAYGTDSAPTGISPSLQSQLLQLDADDVRHLERRLHSVEVTTEKQNKIRARRQAAQMAATEAAERRERQIETRAQRRARAAAQSEELKFVKEYHALHP
ncbi:hypothetical protein ADEAN_000832800 [Angomonas deanei]|uniref:Uncharacterized protein n=1 Tax=Angomonas deanei TaxID=59799 RepID=A0A7G2CMZ9_9TRYP|nr:hypothetical protein ADEAN_000832800 [Angomonas deanei]